VVGRPANLSHYDNPPLKLRFFPRFLVRSTSIDQVLIDQQIPRYPLQRDCFAMVQIVLKSELWKHCKCLVLAADRMDMLSFVKRVATSDTLDLDDFHLELRPYTPPGPPCQCTWTKPWCARHPRRDSADDDSGDDVFGGGHRPSSDSEFDEWERRTPTEAPRALCGGLTEASYLARTVARRLPRMKF
jgi:hypothetical protein